MLILVDLDGPIADFELGVYRELAWQGLSLIGINERRGFHVADDYENKFGPKAREQVIDAIREPGFYLRLPIVEASIIGLEVLLSHADVRICTSPLLINPTCASDKLAWVEEYLGKEWLQRTIITRDKTWIRGDTLIDDKPRIEGSLTPQWNHVLFDAPYNRDVILTNRMKGWDDWTSLLKGERNGPQATTS